MTRIQDIDYSKYNTFFLLYYKFPKDKYCSHNHLIRPSTATYELIIDISKDRIYMLEGAIASFDEDESMSQILIECSLLGITLDFVDILVPCERPLECWDDSKVFQVIDMHKEDIRQHIDKIEAPKHYIAINKKNTDNLKFLVVDSTLQDPNIDFFKGDYDLSAVVAGFKNKHDAYLMCKNLNREK